MAEATLSAAAMSQELCWQKLVSELGFDQKELNVQNIMVKWYHVDTTGLQYG